MAEVNFKLREQLKRLEDQLYEGRGEWQVCYACPLQLLCFMKQPVHRVRWCMHCDGWVLDDPGLVVRCAGFRIKSYTQHQLAAKEGHCPNCNRLDDRFGTYQVIDRKIMVSDIGRLDFANKNT